MPDTVERIDDSTPEAARRGHECRYRLAAGFIKPGDVVLDAACGTGYGAVYLNAGSYVGVDLCVPDANRPARRRFIRADLEVWQPLFVFDVGISFETIEHLDDYSCLVDTLHMARRWILASVPVVPTVGSNPYHCHDFVPGDLAGMLAHPDWELYQTLRQPAELAEIVIMRRRSQ